MARPRVASFTLIIHFAEDVEAILSVFFQLVSFPPLKVPSFKAMVFDC